MSFEKWITNMSPGEMIPLIIGLSVSILFMMATYFTFRKSSLQLKSVKIYLKRERWRGDLLSSRIEFWQQTNVMLGNNLFFDIYFRIDEMPQLFCAKALIAPAQIHLLRKGLSIVVKKGRGNKIAIMQIGDVG
ncbi:hypothetical protein [Klebsiella aerogenes]|uniref:hypothetical protein n=1 Tax=Klebsiella aerogenes TaxID=548 RepID=UPI0005EE0895|nr:hypothetical protein [Klebsiella aerogenes]AWD04696.1 hypothetical protein AM407_17540 [Klebsiella aerogenes]EJC6253243.1 hypothetical protein [Klebsiella aerogenes]ELA2477377.1 hypothetical protein [Klebsiella aerogenes]KJM46042.1 hypothetical protein SS20_11955 [Klebsiella aerogenes]MCA4047920.1 hypothetical protein [Klebsiella aerogenes]